MVNKVRKCCSYLKKMIQAHLHVGFMAIFFIKRASLKWFCLYIKLLQASTIFKQIDNHEVFCNWNFYIKFFTSLNSKNIIATLRIVTVKIVDIPPYIKFSYLRVSKVSWKFRNQTIYNFSVICLWNLLSS